MGNWNDVNDLSHGWALVPLAFFCIWKRRKAYQALARDPSPWGIGIVSVGVAMYLVAVRTLQPRVMVVSLPIMLLGIVVYAEGWRRGREMAFPIFLILFGMPVPGMLQATNKLQVFATEGAELLVTLVGIEVSGAGNLLRSADDSWGFDVAEGCSGVRSLMAILLISALYGYFNMKGF